jgi:hypothetical protein
MDMGSFVVGLLIGVIAVVLILRTHSAREIRKRTKEDFDKNFSKWSRQIWARHTLRFPESIQMLSPQFCAIYAEAAAAEAGELIQICGLGYGKALEFLMKDYAKRENPDLHRDRAVHPWKVCKTVY